MPDSFFTYISKRSYQPNKTVLVINNSMYRKRNEKLSKNLQWWGLVVICSVLVYSFQLIKAIADNNTPRFWFASFLLLATILITLFIFVLNYILKSWYRACIIISPEQISISRQNPFIAQKIQIDTFTKSEIFINQIISEKRAKLKIESGISNTEFPVEYEYIKGKETALELSIRYMDSDGKSQENLLYKIAPKLLKNEHRQIRELNSILTEIQFAIESPGKEFNKLKSLEQIPIKTYTVYMKKGPQKELFKMQILDASLVSKGRAFETGTLVTICLNTLLFEENSARKKSPQSISLQYRIIDGSETQLFLSLPENSYGYTDVSKGQKFYFNEDLNFLKEHSAIYWDLKKNCFLY